MVRSVATWGPRRHSVLVVGLGSVGLDFAARLAAAGITSLRLMDFDTIRLHNLDRLIGATATDAWLRPQQTRPPPAARHRERHRSLGGSSMTSGVSASKSRRSSQTPAILEKYRHLAIEGAPPQRTGLPHLTAGEQALHAYLAEHAASQGTWLLLEQQAAEVLLEHKRHELPSVSVAVAARMLGVSRTTVEAWRQAEILTPASARRRRHEVTTDSLVRLHALLDELRRTGKDRELREYVWWSAQDTADYADSMLAEALRQLDSGELSEEYAPSEKDLAWARRALDGSSPREGP